VHFKWHRCCDCNILADQIYDDLKKFKRWAPNSYADANLFTLPNCGPGVAFGTPGWMGVGMDFANQDCLDRDDADTNPVWVSLNYDDPKRTFTARTLGRHMLVGVRKWSVAYREVGDHCMFTVQTWAVDKARNLRNWVGAMSDSGRAAQENIWVEYLNNVVAPHRGLSCFVSGDSNATPDTHEIMEHNPYLP